MNNLSNLRYFSIQHFLRYQHLNFPGIGKLKFLQQLHEFTIKNENGYRIEELEHINELLILENSNITDVRDAQEACNAKLCDKRKFAHLSLDWGTRLSHEDHDLDERVLDNLQPHNYLKTLLRHCYMGARCAIWMNEANLIKNLEKIHLSGCLEEWEILPPFGQLPFLKTLSLENMPKVKQPENKFHGNDMCCVFRSLETLYFDNLEALVDWFDASVVDDLFPSLTSLTLKNCPNLNELAYLPPKLKSLATNNIGWKTLNCCNISKHIPLKSKTAFKDLPLAIAPFFIDKYPFT